MTEFRRNIPTGIAKIPRVSWGAHFCHFFKGREDLSALVVPFIQAALANNEKCIWVTSNPLPSSQALTELSKSGMSVTDYINSGQLTIVDHDAWYTKQAKFDAGAVLQRWLEAERVSLDKGYSGLRAVGIASWLAREDRRSYFHYEFSVDTIIKKHRIVALYSYPLDSLGIDEVIEVVTNHGLILVQRANELIAIGNSRSGKIRVMKEGGLSFSAIGNKLGISKQRAYQISNGLNNNREVKRTPQTMLTSSDVALLLNIHINTVRRWSNQGILSAYRVGLRGDRRFKRDDVEKLTRTSLPNRL